MNTRQKTALTAPLALLLRTAWAGLGGIIIGGLIIIVGFIIVWKLISFMNKYFPPNAGDNGGGWPDPNVTNVVADIGVNFQQPQAKAPAVSPAQDDKGMAQPSCDCGCSFFIVLTPDGQLVLTNASAGSVRSPVEPDVTGLPFIIEQSQDLLNWTPIQIQTNWGAVAVPCSNSFYRAVQP